MTCIFLYLQQTSFAFQTFAVKLTLHSLFIINQSVWVKFSAFLKFFWITYNQSHNDLPYF